MNRLSVALVAAGALALAGCEGMATAAQSKTVQGATMGSLLGAGAGAIIGNQSGNAGAGTAIGALLGGLGGGMMGKSLQEQDNKYERQQMPAATGILSKFCPVGGELYGEDLKYCPNHGVELRYKEQ